MVCFVSYLGPNPNLFATGAIQHVVECRQCKARLIAPVKTNWTSMTVRDAFGRQDLVSVQVDMLEDVNILLICIWWKV